ncbi:MAG: outer membrane protein transport protein, partial [Spirochaetes bacterium]|nr:outer membrane protein transport protein [Spirochaetota bacterium]
MLKNRFFIPFLTSVACIAALTGDAFANAFDQNNIGMRGVAMASAFTAVADDATAVYYNPAGMTAIKDGTWNYDADLIIIFSEFMWEDPAGEHHKSDEMVYIPGAYAATSSGDLSYGIGIYAPYGGGGVKYDNGFEATIAYFAVTPSVAYKITPEFSAGVGLSLYYGIMEMTMPGNADVKFNGISGWGWNAGLMYRATDVLNIALSVKSQVPIKMTGDATLTSGVPAIDGDYDGEAEFKFPFYYIAAIAYKLTPDILIDVDFWYMQWEKMDKIGISAYDVPLTGDLKYN